MKHKIFTHKYIELHDVILYLLFVFYINGKPKKKKLEHEGGGCGREKTETGGSEWEKPKQGDGKY